MRMREGVDEGDECGDVLLDGLERVISTAVNDDTFVVVDSRRFTHDVTDIG